MSEIAEIKKGDYVVAKHQGKHKLVRVLSNRDDMIRGKHEFKDQEIDLEFETGIVKANLGPDPQIGSVYGCKTERLIDVTATKPIPVVEWYFNAQDESKEQVHDGILGGAKLLKKHGLHAILKVVKAKITFNTATKLKGKTLLGTYSAKGASDENPDVLMIKYHPDAVPFMPYLICHEAGHGIWYRLMPQQIKARWIVQFWERSVVTEIDADTVAEAIKMCVREKSVWLSDQDLQSALDSALANISAATGVRWQDLQLLLDTNVPAAKAILGPWRQYPSADGERDMLVTDYSKTNVEEFWCESLAAYCTGTSLPEYLHELMEDTLNAVRGKDVYVAEED